MPESEKITINMSAVDLGKVDLLVQEGLYSNRTDFIRTAIRAQLEKHTLEVQQSVTRYSFGIGVFAYDRRGLEEIHATGEKININALGLLVLADDIPAGLARETIASIRVRGIFQASAELKEALADRIK